MLPADRNLIPFRQWNARHRRCFAKKIKFLASGSMEHWSKQIRKQKAQKIRQKQSKKPKLLPFWKRKSVEQRKNLPKMCAVCWRWSSCNMEVEFHKEAESYSCLSGTRRHEVLSEKFDSADFEFFHFPKKAKSKSPTSRFQRLLIDQI